MRRYLLSSLILSTLVLFGSGVYAFAQELSTDQINALNDEIEQKQQSIDQLNRQIDTYKDEIEEKQAQEATLYGELDLLDNRIAKTQLDIEATEAEIDLVNAQIALIEQEVHDLEALMNKDLELVAQVLQKIEVQDNTLPLQLVFGTDSFSEFFNNLEQLEAVSSDLKTAVDTARQSKAQLLEKHEAQQGKKDQLTELSESLAQEGRRLEASVGAKSSLLAVTQESEAQFQALLEDLRQEQAYLNQQIALLQKDIEGKLNATDELGDSSILSWPVDPTIRGISAYFHDTSYPFRHLFEHSGLDLPAPTGTPVRAAAPGYVAWTRQGTLYGNYVMIIHTNGLATLYAHLSRIDVTSDQFISRGDQIGAVGSTGLSTGPHLHFEARLNGIPTNPLDYLISY
ncbi:MAG TPA: peptidoglycan DD-metalloendopeptidase family protein [Patescibacteria group bacterium]|nr:peptidoglycan DD-metalloendopeptidase family protein [Patescibacteria group bacterium]